MKNLTEKQQLILNDITNEFKKVNEQKQKPKGKSLLGLDQLVNDKYDEIEDRQQIDIQNKATLKLYNEIVMDAIERLNNEMEEYNLICKKGEGLDFRIGIKDNFSNNIYVYFSYTKIHKNYKSGNSKIIVGEIVGFKTNTSYTDNKHHKTIEELTSNCHIFKSKLRELINNN